MTSATHWQRVEALFDSASRLPAEAREAHLGNSGEPPEIVDEVRSLLRHHEVDATGGPAARALSQAAASLLERGDTVPDHAHLGPYRLLSKLGEGGMGSVWLARRADDVSEHEVAVKQIHAGARGEANVERFRAERRILARLEHPAIARLLDGGTAPDGSPYLVMERVVGVALTEHCEAQRSSLHQRLELFLKVCDAVAYAHRSLVVHRDLKPSNILVSVDGQPKLLDFGIARLLEGTDSGAQATALHLQRFTAEYASPEQVRGEPVTTSTDIYSLGVVLYELLTGSRPHHLDGLGRDEIERRISDSTPDAASVRALTRRTGSDASWARALRGDLDNVLRKALAADPARRYSSVEGFADDIRRFLAQMPVLARPDTWRYRAGKFGRRHRWWLAAASLVLAGVAAFTVALAMQVERTARERDRALDAERRAGEVSGFLTTLFEINDPSESRGNAVTARELLDRGAERIGGELDESPTVQAALLTTMAGAYLGLGLETRGLELQKQALDVREAAVRKEASEANELALAEALQFYGNDLRRLSRFAEAEPVMLRGLALRERILAPTQPAIADSLNDLGLLETETGRLDDGERHLQRALEIRRTALGEVHPLVALTLNNLALVHVERGNFDRAAETHARALEIRRQSLGEDHPQTINSLHAYASSLIRAGKLDEGEKHLRAVVIYRERVLGIDHFQTLNARNALASLLHDRGDSGNAETYYRSNLAGYLRLYGETHLDTAVCLNNMASLLEDMGRFEEAAQLHARSFAARRTVMGGENATVIRSEHNFGRALWAAGNRVEGRRHLDHALAWRRANLSPDHADVAASWIQIGRAARDEGRAEEARKAMNEALAIQRRAWKNGHFRILETHAELIVLEAGVGDAAACRRLLGDAETEAARTEVPAPTGARLEIASGDCLAVGGDLAAARTHWTAGAEKLSSYFGESNPWVRAARRRLAESGASR